MLVGLFAVKVEEDPFMENQVPIHLSGILSEAVGLSLVMLDFGCVNAKIAHPLTSFEDDGVTVAHKSHFAGIRERPPPAKGGNDRHSHGGQDDKPRSP